MTDECTATEATGRWNDDYDARERREKITRQLASIPTRFRRATLESFTLHGTAAEQRRQQGVVSALQGFDLSAIVREWRPIVLIGPVGSGKTHLIAALARAAVMAICPSSHFTLGWVAGADLVELCRDFKRADQFRDAGRGSLLVIDDAAPIGEVSEFVLGRMFGLIDARYRDLEPVWITANAQSKGQLQERLGPQIVDRLFERAIVLECCWPSWRAME